MLRAVWLLLILAGLCGTADAQTLVPLTPVPGSCTTTCTIANLTVTTLTATSASTGTLNNWAPAFGVRDDSNDTPAAAGSGYQQGDVVTLNDGCSTHAKLTVNQASGGIVAYNISSRGVCSSVPANPVGQLSTTGSGTGATFTLSWAPLSSGLLYPQNAGENSGNLFLGYANPGVSTTYAGANSLFIGLGAGGDVQTGDDSLYIGNNACGTGNGTVLTGVADMICIGYFAGQSVGQGAQQDVLIGYNAATGIAAARDVVIGNAAGGGLTSGYNNLILGASAGGVLSTGSNDVFLGYNTKPTANNVTQAVIIGGSTSTGGNGAAGGANSVIIGAAAGNTSLTGANVTAIGFNVANTTCTTANHVLILGVDNTETCTSAGETNTIHVGAGGGDVWSLTGGGTPSTSVTTIAGQLNVNDKIQTSGTYSGAAFQDTSTSTYAMLGIGNYSSAVIGDASTAPIGLFLNGNYSSAAMIVNGTVVLNASAPLATSANVGFVALPYMAGTPTGAPAATTNCAIDTTNSYLNCYFGAAWHKIAFTAGAG